MGVVIDSGIAQRRALTRNERKASDIYTQQKLRYLANSGVSFRDQIGTEMKDPEAVEFGVVDFQSDFQPRTKAIRICDGEPVSPGTIPNMNERTWDEMIDRRFEGYDAADKTQTMLASELWTYEDHVPDPLSMPDMVRYHRDEGRIKKRRAAFEVATAKISKRMKRAT